MFKNAESRLRKKLIESMPSRKELDAPGRGAQRHLAWEQAHKDTILEWKQARRALGLSADYEEIRPDGK